MPDDKCRLAKAEADIVNMTSKLDSIIDTLDEMKQEQTKYKGFVGGVVFAVGAIFSFLTWWTTKQ